jgi:hypothetical protein
MLRRDSEGSVHPTAILNTIFPRIHYTPARLHHLVEEQTGMRNRSDVIAFHPEVCGSSSVAIGKGDQSASCKKRSASGYQIFSSGLIES